MSEPKGVTLEDVAKFIEAEEWVQPAALVRAADRVVAAAIRLLSNGGDYKDWPPDLLVSVLTSDYNALAKEVADFDRAGGGA